MPLLLALPRREGIDVVIVLGPDNIERIQERDPVEVEWDRTPFKQNRVRRIVIASATAAQLTQCEQLVRQGKPDEAIGLISSGWKYRPEKGDHDLGPQRL
jgi:hypothetical protein